MCIALPIVRARALGVAVARSAANTRMIARRFLMSLMRLMRNRLKASNDGALRPILMRLLFFLRPSRSAHAIHEKFVNVHELFVKAPLTRWTETDFRRFTKDSPKAR